MDRLRAVPTIVADQRLAITRLQVVRFRRDRHQSPFPHRTFHADLRHYRFGVDLSTALQNPPWISQDIKFRGLVGKTRVSLKNDATVRSEILSECLAGGFSISSWLGSRCELPP